MNSIIYYHISELNEICHKWKIDELSVFGSATREDFGRQSDIDFLVRFNPLAKWDLWDIVDMKSELETIFRRNVDIVEATAIRNPFRKKEIFTTREIIYAA